MPSLILVFVVILWPVTQSFWNSMFDYRLNDPTRSEKMMDANIDLETYVDNYFFIDSQLESLADAADGDNDKQTDRKSTRLNSSHVSISYAVFCLKKKILLAT